MVLILKVPSYILKCQVSSKVLETNQDSMWSPVSPYDNVVADNVPADLFLFHDKVRHYLHLRKCVGKILTKLYSMLNILSLLFDTEICIVYFEQKSTSH